VILLHRHSALLQRKYQIATPRKIFQREVRVEDKNGLMPILELVEARGWYLMMRPLQGNGSLGIKSRKRLG